MAPNPGARALLKVEEEDQNEVGNGPEGDEDLSSDRVRKLDVPKSILTKLTKMKGSWTFQKARATMMRLPSSIRWSRKFKVQCEEAKMMIMMCRVRMAGASERQ